MNFIINKTLLLIIVFQVSSGQEYDLSCNSRYRIAYCSTVLMNLRASLVGHDVLFQL